MDTATDLRVHETVSALTQAFAGTPWMASPTPEGVVIALDLIDAQWWEVMGRAGLKETYSYTVRFDPAAGTVSVTDTHWNLDWSVGVDGAMRPSARLNAQVQSGRIISNRRTFVWTPLEGTVVDSTFNSETPRATLRGVLDQFGWKEVMGTSQKIGLWVGIAVAVAGLVGAGVALALTVF